MKKLFMKALSKFGINEVELYQAGVPVAVYNKTNISESYVKTGDVYYTLTDKVSGSHVDYKIEANPFSFGKNVTKLHIGLKKLTEKIKCEDIADLIDQLHSWLFCVDKLFYQ